MQDQPQDTTGARRRFQAKGANIARLQKTPGRINSGQEGRSPGQQKVSIILAGGAGGVNTTPDPGYDVATILHTTTTIIIIIMIISTVSNSDTTNNTELKTSTGSLQLIQLQTVVTV
ncbi:hypothetical protein Pmani_018999 [Petrolisthes manimaculis]|uniref:Uncharacterized protein n=1 Tax=Petrolisthes manimaculis TaxID=1843537 RepID=A0AAE1U650_9EUCA|nr:hypothetical protein Pmani_018999 [Petrolisthes manimaculis]